MAQMITCTCGAAYEQTQRRFSVRCPGTFSCQFCAELLQQWNSMHWLHHRMVKGPRDPEAARAKRLAQQSVPAGGLDE